jgi:hypothetical protein
MGEEKQMKKTPNAQRPTSNNQKFRASAFGIGRWTFNASPARTVRRFLRQ